MVQMVDPDLGDTIYDPACGTAGFLIDVVDHILARYSEEPKETPIYGEDWLEKRGQTLDEVRKEIPNLQTYRKGPGERIPDWGRLEASIYGTDVSRQMMRISVMNLVLHGIARARLKRANVLSEMSGLTEDDLNRHYAVILSNPPFAGQVPKESIRRDLPTKAKKSELLFLALMLRSLAPGGRCAWSYPKVRSSVRRRRTRTCVRSWSGSTRSWPWCRFRLACLNPTPGVKTSILVFRRPANELENGDAATKQVWFYEIHNDGYNPKKIQGGGRPETPEKNDVPGLLAAWTEYKSSRFRRLRV